MKVGFVGLGKLGLMVALAAEKCGHEVLGYDTNPSVSGYLSSRSIPFKEESADLLDTTKIRVIPLQELCDWADILFLAIQTPHHPQYGGACPLPDDRKDFDYTFLKKSVSEVDACLSSPKTCVIISTVLPGTIEREIQPLISSNFRLVYEPLFIAMGTVVNDFLNPEFVLCGTDHEESYKDLKRFYKLVHNKPFLRTDMKTAEGIKVFYNTFITAKTVLANMYGEMAYKLDMNVDDIYKAITLSTTRLLSSQYLKSGMGDGGGCHPRDNIALSWLAEEVDLSYNLFEALMNARESHCFWLASLIAEHKGDLPVVILGESFKPETNIKDGSPSVLMSNLLMESGIEHTIGDDLIPYDKALYFIGTQHQKYKQYVFPKGSIVIDPFRYIEPKEGITIIPIGAKRTNGKSMLTG